MNCDQRNEFESLVKLKEGLDRSASLQEGAQCLLSALLEESRLKLMESSFHGSGEMLRAFLHLRPRGEYIAPVLAYPERVEEEAAVASASLWRWLDALKCPLSIEAPLRLVRPHREEVESFTLSTSGPSGELSAQTSLLLYLDRDATHILVFPLWSLEKEVVGMISLEARCRAALGEDFIWKGIEPLFEMMTHLALPYLLALPVEEDRVEEDYVDDLLPVVGQKMKRQIRVLRTFAQQEETLLIAGPTGSGKSRLARWCHARSKRSDGPFEVLDLLAVPPEMQMAHLVGWRRGAFTGASGDHEGTLSRAEGGTLFLDEIDKLSLEMQAGLLRLLEEQRYHVLGQQGTAKIANVRFIVGTNVDLAEAVREGKIREDLYYRINVLPLRLLPLDERRDEIPAWATFMLNRWLQERGHKGAGTISSEAERLLLANQWPGNLRQLDNVLRRALTLAMVDGEGPRLCLRREHLQGALAMDGSSATTSALERALQEAANCFISLVLERAEEPRGRDLTLDHSDAFRGLILETALDRMGELDQVFELLGKERLVSSRNHHKTFAREQQKLEELRALLRQPGT